MVKRENQNAPRRLDRPEFTRIVRLVEDRFGPTTPETQFTLITRGYLRVRVMLARKTGPSQRYSFSAGKRDFDFLAFGLEGREEVFSVPMPSPGRTAIFMRELLVSSWRVRQSSDARARACWRDARPRRP